MSLFPDLTEPIKFFVDHEPVPQPRQRHRVMKGGFVVNYTPKSHPVNLYKECVRIKAKSAYPGKMLEGPLGVSLLFLLDRPARLIWKRKPMPRAWAPVGGNGDADNYAKAVLDALQPQRGEGSWGLFKDDSQVVELYVRKMYRSGDESCGVECVVQELAYGELPAQICATCNGTKKIVHRGKEYTCGACAQDKLSKLFRGVLNA